MVSDLLNVYFWETVFKAAGFSLGRLLATYLICLVISLVITIWLASSRKAEKIAVPIFDLVQNIPPLAFYPIAALLFIKTGPIDLPRPRHKDSKEFLDVVDRMEGIMGLKEN